MKPIKFKEHNVVYGENQKQYNPLPAFKNDSIKGEVVTCWNMSLKERIRALFKGNIYVCQLTFNSSLQPLILTTLKSDLLEDNKNEEV